ncbi:MAG: CobD/CbiB family protein [Rhodocyclales bacterium]|nr:CobD/CbiB family protein [Rhodocyclales bacterium]
MTLLSLLVVLVIEQVYPLLEHGAMGALRRHVVTLHARLVPGARSGGGVAWWLTVLGATGGAGLAYGLLHGLHPLFGFVFSVGALYFAFGYRDEIRSFSDIHLALSTGETEQARALLERWCGLSLEGASADELTRLAIEQALVRAHRRLFGLIFWLVLLPGPSGAVLYRVANMLVREGSYAERAFAVLDWLPVRLTAVAYAVIGNFENAIYCWRTQSTLWPDGASGILISSGGGALGVRLGLPIHESGRVVERPEMGTGDIADVSHMHGAAKIAWRVLVLYLLLLALLQVAG